MKEWGRIKDNTIRGADPMFLFRTLKSRKYMQHLLLSFSMSAVGLLAVFSFLYYGFAKELVLGVQKQSNEKILSQIEYNINYLNEIVRHIAIMMSFDKSMVYLMNAREPDPVTKFQTLRMLDTVADSTSFVDSIAVYNGTGGRFYFGGSGAWSRTNRSRLQEMILQQLRRTDHSPSGKLVPMKTDEDSPNVDLFSFFVLDGHPTQNAAPNAVIVNIRPQWIFDNISRLNEMTDREDVIVVLDENGRVLASHNGDAGTDEEEWRRLAALSWTDAVAADGKWTLRKHEGRSYFVSAASIGPNDWKIVRILSYDKVMGRVASFKTISLILFAVALVAALALSAAVASRLYRPIDKLTELFSRHSSHADSRSAPRSEREEKPDETGPPIRDEINYISGIYKIALDELQAAYRKERRNRQIASDYYLRCWMTDSEAMTPEEMRECAAAFPRLFVRERNKETVVWRLAVLSPDSPDASSRTPLREELYRFAMCNIVEETLARSYPVHVLDMKNEFAVAIVRMPSGIAGSEELKADLKQAIDVCRQYYGRTFSASIGSPLSDPKLASRAYQEGVQQLMYRLAFGRGSVIAREDVAANLERQDAAIPPDWEKKLSEAIRSKDPKAIDAVLDRWFAAIAAFPYDYMTFSVQQIVLIVRQTLREPAFSAANHSVGLQTLGAKVIRSDTLAEMRAHIGRFLERLCAAELTPQKDRNRMIVDAVKEYVEKNAQDPNLSLQSAAAYFKMSPAYVGRIFKQCEGTSVGDYINGHRLELARDMLLGSDWSVKEIADYYGFSNSNYFITLFKKKYGMTPKEFRMSATFGGKSPDLSPN
jgi:AraC-like DNA-binding protein